MDGKMANLSKSICFQDHIKLLPSLIELVKIWQTPSAKFSPPAEKILHSLSFSHISLLLTCENPLQRAFYEVESIRGGWSVRELKRQIESLLFERTGLSKDKEQLLRRTH